MSLQLGLWASWDWFGAHLGWIPLFICSWMRCLELAGLGYKNSVPCSLSSPSQVASDFLITLIKPPIVLEVYTTITLSVRA